MDKSVLNKATSADVEPTSAWLIHEIAKMTKTNYSTCQQVQDWLLYKLKTEKNVHALRKTLAVVKATAQNGDASFALDLARKSEDIKMLANWRGPADPLHGDGLNQAVRTTAQQAIDAIFERSESLNRNRFVSMGNEFQPASSTPIDSHIGTFKGLGSQTSYPTANGDSFAMPTTSRFTGIGPTGPMANQPNPVENQSFLGKSMSAMTAGMGAVASVFTRGKGYDGPALLATNIGSDGGGGDIYRPPVMLGSFTETNKPMSPSFGGGGFGGAPVASPGSGAALFNIQQNQPTQYENAVVDEFTNATGVRPAPTKQEVSAFVSRCSSLNADTIVQLLDQKLASQASSWQVRLKALYAIEGLLKASNMAASAYFAHNYANIQKQSMGQSEACVKQASKILALLNKGGNLPSVSPSGSKVSTPASLGSPSNAVSTSLLEMESMTAPSPQQQQPVQQLMFATPQVESTMSMFGNMKVNTSPVQQQQQPVQQQQVYVQQPVAHHQAMQQPQQPQQPKSSLISPDFDFLADAIATGSTPMDTNASKVEKTKQMLSQISNMPSVPFSGFPAAPGGIVYVMPGGVVPGAGRMATGVRSNSISGGNSALNSGGLSETTSAAFDFLNKQATANTPNLDSHFEFVKAELKK